MLGSFHRTNRFARVKVRFELRRGLSSRGSSYKGSSYKGSSSRGSSSRGSSYTGSSSRDSSSRYSSYGESTVFQMSEYKECYDKTWSYTNYPLPEVDLEG